MWRKFPKPNETVSNPSQEKAPKRHNLLHRIRSVNHLELCGPSKPTFLLSPQPWKIVTSKNNN